MLRLISKHAQSQCISYRILFTAIVQESRQRTCQIGTAFPKETKYQHSQGNVCFGCRIPEKIALTDDTALALNSNTSRVIGMLRGFDSNPQPTRRFRAKVKILIFQPFVLPWVLPPSSASELSTRNRDTIKKVSLYPTYTKDVATNKGRMASQKMGKDWTVTLLHSGFWWG